MSKYEVIIYWSKDDQAFIAEVPELPGCTVDGATPGHAGRDPGCTRKHWRMLKS